MPEVAITLTVWTMFHFPESISDVSAQTSAPTQLLSTPIRNGNFFLTAKNFKYENFISTHFVTFSGLQLRVKDGQSYNFDFTWSPVTEVPQVIDWVEIRKNESTFPHIRCYWLDDEKEEEVPAFMADVLESSAKALLLVNTKNNFEIESKFLPPNQKCVFPVAVVTNFVGKTLKDVIDRYGNKVHARLEIESVTTDIQATEIKQPEEELPQESQGSVSPSALHMIVMSLTLDNLHLQDYRRSYLPN